MTEDNALTTEDEGTIPRSELEVFWNFNPRNSVPTFVFGCKYYRIGTEYEDQDNINAEKRDFREVIDKLLTEA